MSRVECILVSNINRPHSRVDSNRHNSHHRLRIHHLTGRRLNGKSHRSTGLEFGYSRSDTPAP
jgi:hypothetical protein